MQESYVIRKCKIVKVISEVFRGPWLTKEKQAKDFQPKGKLTSARLPVGGGKEEAAAKPSHPFSPQAVSSPQPRPGGGDQGPLACFYCRAQGHRKFQCEKCKQDETAMQGGGQWTVWA